MTTHYFYNNNIIYFYTSIYEYIKYINIIYVLIILYFIIIMRGHILNEIQNNDMIMIFVKINWCTIIILRRGFGSILHNLIEQCFHVT